MQVIFWRVATLIGTRVNGTHESNKFIRDNPVQISILDFFIVLVFFIVKIFEYIPAMAYSNF